MYQMACALTDDFSRVGRLRREQFGSVFGRHQLAQLRVGVMHQQVEIVGLDDFAELVPVLNRSVH